MDVIINPVARRGKALTVAAYILKLLDERPAGCTAHYTSGPGDAAATARTLAESGAERVLCVGGDGTVSEVMAGLANTGTSLGIIPAGTGDDFARSLGIPAEPGAALETALGNRVRSVDIGYANDRAFVNVAGVGFDVAVLRATLRYKRVVSGLPAYLLGVIDTLFHYRGVKIEIETADGETTTHEALLAAVANGRYVGGGMCIAPEAIPDDGLFDIVLVDRVPRWKVPFLLGSFVKGRHIGWPFVHCSRCREIRIAASDASLQLDGEIFTEQSVAFRLSPGAVRLVVGN